jgi:hypothetical protein
MLSVSLVNCLFLLYMLHCRVISSILEFILLVQVQLFWVMMLCSVVVGYQCFRGPCCLHLLGNVTGMGKYGIDIGLDWRGAVDASY